MKNRFLFFVSTLFLVASSVCAQVNKYYPLVDSGNIWYSDYYSADYEDDNYIYDEGFSIYIIGGDTIINNLHYRKLLQSSYGVIGQDETPGYYPLYFDDNVIREDTINRKVYALGPEFSQTSTYTEELLYDFNLQVGDTVDNNDDDPYVIFIDSVKLDDGEYHKRWGFQSWLDTIYGAGADTTYLIEGVGATTGFPSMVLGIYGEEYTSWWLSCFSKQDNMVYKSPWSTPFDSGAVRNGLKLCQTPTAIYNPNTVTAQLFPNPVTQGGNITIKGITEEYTFTLDNLLGQAVFSKEITSPSQPINLPNSITSGVYLCHIKTQSGLLFVKKIVVL